MICVWDLIQNDPTGSGLRNGWGLHKIRLALSRWLCGWVMDAGGWHYCSLYLYVSVSIILIIKRKRKLKRRAGEKKQSLDKTRECPRQLKKEGGSVHYRERYKWPTSCFPARPFLCCFSHGLHSSTGHFADTPCLFLILRTALWGSILLLYSFYMGHLDRGNHRGSWAPEKPWSDRAWWLQDSPWHPPAALCSAALLGPASSLTLSSPQTS